jgi:hypothetical protein
MQATGDRSHRQVHTLAAGGVMRSSARVISCTVLQESQCCINRMIHQRINSVYQRSNAHSFVKSHSLLRSVNTAQKADCRSGRCSVRISIRTSAILSSFRQRPLPSRSATLPFYATYSSYWQRPKSTHKKSCDNKHSLIRIEIWTIKTAVHSYERPRTVRDTAAEVCPQFLQAGIIAFKNKYKFWVFYRWLNV